jgi:aryl-alcohol dehydrogenase-like predicted oxidoreductase
MNFGPFTEEKEAFAIMDQAVDAGINFFDTANVYGGTFGGPGNNGRTEELIGRWFAQGGGRRDKVVLATKVFGDMHDSTDGPNAGNGLSAYKIRRHLEGSLRRLQTDHIELYQMHHIERNATWDEIWGVFEALVNQGKTLYIGSCNFAGWYLALAQAEAGKRNFLGLVSEQHKYNLMCRLPELEVLPAAQGLGLGVIPWSPLAGGLLNGNALKPVGGSRGEKIAGHLTETERQRLKAYADLCAGFGESESNISLAWLLANPAVTAPIIGPRTLKQFDNSMKAVEIKLSDEVLGKLDEIFPGPGGRAPEAYAW